MNDGADIAHAQIPTLVPPRSPQELREWTVEDYGRMARRFGAADDRAALEQRALSDLQIADAVKREAPPPLPPSVDTVRHQRATRQEKADAKAATVGAEIQRGNGQQVVRQASRLLHAPSLPDSRWSFAKGRMSRIMAGATKHADPAVMVSTCEMPKLALKALRLYAFVATRRAPPRAGDESNPFFGLSPADFARKLQRSIEDICDESTGRLGPWWVPK